MKHYTKEELELYRNGKMSVLGKILCSVHLKKCKKCADLLAELTEDSINKFIIVGEKEDAINFKKNVNNSIKVEIQI